MIQGSTTQTTIRNLASQIGFATTAMIGSVWIAIVMLSGSMIPRGTLIGAVLAVAVAMCAYRAIRANEAIVLAIVVPFGAIIPPELGQAPEVLRFVGFLSLGYVIAAILLIASTKLPRRVG